MNYWPLVKLEECYQIYLVVVLRCIKNEYVERIYYEYKETYQEQTYTLS